MLIMVIRTNTPRSVIGNSFGYQKIDIPDAPQGFLILDQPHYNNYNADCAANNSPPVSFGDITGLKEFSNQIHEAIFEKEFNEMYFEQWLREMDNYSFMYTHYLNERGLITPQRNQPNDV
jgi:tRNA pseudouridine38-40 synthase